MGTDAPVRGPWDRGSVTSLKTAGGKKADWNTSALLSPVVLPPEMEAVISPTDPRTCSLVVNGPYQSDPAGVDSYTPSFLNAGGDCDSKVCSAMDVCFTYLRDTWVPFMAIGDAWLDSGGDGIKKIHHSYAVFVNRKTGKVVLDELTYLKRGPGDLKNPSSSHIISCEWLIGPNYVIKVQETNNLAVDAQVTEGRLDRKFDGNQIVTGEKNVALEDAIGKAVRPRIREVNAAYDGFDMIGPRIELRTLGKNEYGMPILHGSETTGVADH